MPKNTNPISFRAGHLYGELEQRGNPSLAAKYATRRYLALVAEHQGDANERFSEADRAFLYSQVFPTLPLDSDSTFAMIAAWAEHAGADETLAQKLRRAPLVEIDALIDDWRKRQGTRRDEHGEPLVKTQADGTSVPSSVFVR